MVVKHGKRIGYRILSECNSRDPFQIQNRRRNRWDGEHLRPPTTIALRKLLISGPLHHPLATIQNAPGKAASAPASILGRHS